MTNEELKKELEKMVNPFQNKTLKELDAIKHVGINEEKQTVILIIAIGQLQGDEERYMRKELARKVKIDLEFNGIKIQFEQLQKIACEKAKVILIGGCKGGTGKTTVACNIAYQLQKMGKKVGLIDADIYGSSVLQMLSITPTSLHVNDYGKVIPYNFNGMEIVSTEFFNDPNEGLLWRGNVVVNMISNFLYQVSWNKDLDFLIIDLPSDTSEVLTEINSYLPSAEILLVTTPHISSSHVVIRAGNASRQLSQSIIGVVENMTGFPVSENEEAYLNTSGGLIVSKNLGVEFLASIKFAPALHHICLYEDDEENSQTFKDLATLISIR